MGKWKTPNPRLVVTDGPLSVPDGTCEAHRSVRNHHFVESVEIFYPGPGDVDGDLEARPFTLAEVSLVGLLEESFMEKYIRTGRLFAMAIDHTVERSVADGCMLGMSGPWSVYFTLICILRFQTLICHNLYLHACRHNTACVAAGVLHLSVDDMTYSILGEEIRAECAILHGLTKEQDGCKHQ